MNENNIRTVQVDEDLLEVFNAAMRLRYPLSTIRQDQTLWSDIVRFPNEVAARLELPNSSLGPVLFVDWYWRNLHLQRQMVRHTGQAFTTEIEGEKYVLTIEPLSTSKAEEKDYANHD